MKIDTLVGAVTRPLQLRVCFSLSQCFIERDAARDGGVERVDVTMHGKLDKQVAVFAHQTTDTLTFVADDERQWAGQIGFLVFGGGLTCQPDHPDILLLEDFNGAREIGFLGNEEVFRRTGGGFDHGSVDLHGTMFRQNDPVYPGPPQPCAAASRDCSHPG